MNGNVPKTKMERWLFRRENRIYRYFLIIISLSISIYCYGIFNLFIGSLSFFLFIYLLGVFKSRKKIDLLINEDPVNVATKITGLVNAARSEIKILTGSINPQVYCHEDVLCALDKALKRGVEAYFITNWQAAKKNAEKNEVNAIIDWAKNNRLKIYDFGSDTDEINHFIVVDKRSFRVEGKHSPDSDSRLAVTAYNNKRALKFLKFFDDLIYEKEAKMIYPKRKFTLV